LASRRPVWDETVSAIQEHPWFGSGFGISPTSSEVVTQIGSFESLRETAREHGNSYLAITEWVGFAGDIPFFALILMVAVNVGRVLRQMRRTGNISSVAVPLAGVLAAGLVHAAFEDWLFAAGYYLCIFFWALAFIMVDVLQFAAPVPALAAERMAHPWINDFGVAAPGR
jgi:O-antigen ligase